MEKPSFPNPLPDPGRLAPPQCLKSELPVWDIREFFKTTGDAIQKLRGIWPDLLAYRAKVRDVVLALEPSACMAPFAAEVHVMVDGLEEYRQRLVAMRGDAIFLETSHEPGLAEPHRLKPKNPRPKP